MSSLFDAVTFGHGPTMPNRFMLAPLTNQQSHADGTLSDDEFHWLTMRAAGGFGLTMTCAAHVQAVGQGFAGQLGVFADEQIPGLSRLAAAIKKDDSVAIMQLHHAGRRSPRDLIGADPVCPMDDSDTGARALTTAEVEALVADFISAAGRADKAGFDGIELHGAHDYILCQFLNPELNVRTDHYGGNFENRTRLIREILAGIRATCRSDFNVSIRLSPERFGMNTNEIVALYEELATSGELDFIDMSLWDVFKPGAEPGFEDRRLIDVFAPLERGSCRLAVAGKLYSAEDCRRAIDAGADMVAIGRGAILHHDFPKQVSRDENFVVRPLPVAKQTLRDEGLSDTFIGYMGNWKGFVADE